MLTKEERIYLIKCYGIGNVSYQYAIDVFHEKFPNTPVSKKALRRLLKKFNETGSVMNVKKPKKKYDQNDAATVLAIGSVLDNPKLSLRNRAQTVDLSKSELHTIFKENKIIPFKPKIRHTLEPGDEERRLEFCLWIGEKYLENQRFHRFIFFTDESTFHTNGHVSSQNSRHWAYENPNYVINKGSQRYKKVNVWCGIFYDRIIGPYFIEGNLNQHVYLDILEQFVLPFLNTLEPEVRNNMFWQQDGCPAHCTALVRQWLNDHFGAKWIGRFGPNHYPARSPDLSLLDFFLWGALKQKVYSDNLPHDREILKQRIEGAIHDLNVPRIIRKVYGKFIKLAEKCVMLGGSYVE